MMCSTSSMHLMERHHMEPDTSTSSGIALDGESEMLLQALNGFLIVVEADGEIFYASPSIVDFLGFHNVDVMHQNVFELIHKEDRVDFQKELVLRGVPPAESDTTKVTDVEGSLDRNFLCRFRCLLDESSGFLNLHFTGKLRPMYGQRTRGEDGKPTDVDPPKMGLFALACPAQQPSIMEIYVRNMIFRTKHELNFKPLSLDSKASDILGYTESEMIVMNGYNYLHYEDIIYCSDMHSQLIRKGETHFIYFRLMTKATKWLWVQAKGRVIYKNGKPESLVSTHRPMSDEEGDKFLANRGAPFKFPFEGPAELYGCNPPMPKEIYKAITMGGGGPPGSMGGPPPGLGGPPPGVGGPGFGGPPDMGGPPGPGLPTNGRHLLPGRPSGTIPSVSIPPMMREVVAEGETPRMKMESISPPTNTIKEERGQSPEGLAGQRLLQRMPIPEDSMAKRLMDQDLAEALKNIHFDNSLENISNSAWLKEFEQRQTGQSVSFSVSEGVATSQQQPTLKYSPGSSPQCLYQERLANDNPHPSSRHANSGGRGDVQSGHPQNNNNEDDRLGDLPTSSRGKTPVSSTGKSPHSTCHSDSGMESDEARSGIHHIEEDLALIEAALNHRQGTTVPKGRGPLESTDSIESGFDLSELDVAEFEGTEINLDEVLNLMEGVETADLPGNIGRAYVPPPLPLGAQQTQKRAAESCQYSQERPGPSRGGAEQDTSQTRQIQQPSSALLHQQSAPVGQRTFLYNSKRTVPVQRVATSSCIRGTQTSPATFDMAQADPVIRSVDLSTQTNSGSLSGVANFGMAQTDRAPPMMNLNIEQGNTLMSADFGMTHTDHTLVASELNRTPTNDAMSVQFGMAQTNPEFTHHHTQHHPCQPMTSHHQFPGHTTVSMGQMSHQPLLLPSNPLHPSQGLYLNHSQLQQPPQYSEHVVLGAQEPAPQEPSHFQRTPHLAGLSSNSGVMTMEQGQYFYQGSTAAAPSQNGIQSLLPEVVDGRYVAPLPHPATGGCHQNGFPHPGEIQEGSHFIHEQVPLSWGSPSNGQILGLNHTRQGPLVIHN